MQQKEFNIRFNIYFLKYAFRRDNNKFRYFDIEIEEMGNLEINHNGTLTPRTFIKLYRIIYKHSRKALFVYRNQIMINRTRWYNNDDEEGYRKWIKKLIDKNRECLDQFKARAIKNFTLLKKLLKNLTENTQ